MRENLPKRKHSRLKYYGYSKEGYYFITICTKKRLELLGNIENANQIKLTRAGEVAHKYIKEIEHVYEKIQIDEYVIMPNHIHMIIIIKEKERISISKVIQQYKGMVTKELGYSIWQKLFYEHIIRTEKDYYIIKEYIQNNISNWEKDIYF